MGSRQVRIHLQLHFDPHRSLSGQSLTAVRAVRLPPVPFERDPRWTGDDRDAGVPFLEQNSLPHALRPQFNRGIMDPLLKLLASDASLSTPQLAAMLDLTEAEVRDRIRQAERDRFVLGYRAVLNEEKLGRDLVRAMIEVKITPERGGGFDKLAERIAKYSEVRSCHLMSGGYDLLVEVEGTNLREVATFVSEKLSTIQGVLSTATHFVLRAYKEQGVLMAGAAEDQRLAIAP
jgi:DNA-binding Lrp family transcriptional regulator